jgi:hypothetical protein
MANTMAGKEGLSKLDKVRAAAEGPEGPQAAGATPQLAWILRQSRQKAGLSLAQLHQSTKIHPRLLEALEEGEFRKLPSPAHQRAFSLAHVRACQGDEKAVLEALRALGLPTRELPAAPPPPSPASAEVPELEVFAAPYRAGRPAPQGSWSLSTWMNGSSAWFVWAGLALGAMLILWLLSALAPAKHGLVVPEASAAPSSQAVSGRLDKDLSGPASGPKVRKDPSGGPQGSQAASDGAQD